MTVDHDEEYRKNNVRLFRDMMFDDKHGIDLYLPPERLEAPEGGYPTIFYIHGGAWHSGDKRGAREPCEHLAREGYACVATSYELSSVDDGAMEILFIIILCVVVLLTFMSSNVILAAMIGTLLLITYVCVWMFMPRKAVQHPEHIRGVVKGFKYAKDVLPEYGCKSDSMFVMGHSAGAHLGALMSTNEKYLQEQGLSLENIQGFVGLSGVYSDKRLSRTKLGSELLKSTFGTSEAYVDAFPVYNVVPESPPSLLINAGSDLGLKSGTADLHYALRQQAIWSEVHYFNNLTHFSIYADWQRGGKNERILDTTLEFLKQAQTVDRTNH